MPQHTASQHTDRTFQAWLVILSASLYFFYEFIQLNLFNAIDVPLMRDFHLGAAGLGQLASLYFYANATFLFPAGIMLDRFSTRRLLLVAVTMTFLGTLVFAEAHTYAVAAFARLVVGVGAAFCFLSCMRLASRWFPPEKMAFVTAVVVTMAMLGGLVAQTPMAWLSEQVGWRMTVRLDAVLGVVVAVIIYCFVEDFPAGSKSHRAHQATLPFFAGLCQVLRNPNNWFGGIYTSLMNLPVFLLGALWGMHYLVVVHHISLIQASSVTTLFFVGVIFGSLAYGWFSDHLGRRVAPMLLGAIVSLAVMLVLLLARHLTLWELRGLFFLVGFVTSSQVLSYPLIAELNPISITSTAISIDSVTIMVSGAISQPFFGWLLSRHATVAADGSPVYFAHDFMNAMLIMPVAFLLAFATGFLLKESYCKSQA